MIRYILSIDHHLHEAVTAVDNKKQTLLHLACSLNEGDSVQRKEVVRLLLKKGLDPTAVDSNSRKALDLLRTRDNSLWQQLKSATGMTIVIIINRLFMEPHLVRARSAYKGLKGYACFVTHTHTHTHTHTLQIHALLVIDW